MTASLFVDWMGKFEMHTNALPPNDQEMCHRAGGDSNIYYHNSRWRLAPHEALVIEATPPECATWNLQVGNFWMESLDYRYHRVHLNKFTADVESDGSVKIVLAHRDPGSGWPNWLETCDHSEGAMLFRYVGAKGIPGDSYRGGALRGSRRTLVRAPIGSVEVAAEDAFRVTLAQPRCPE